MHVRTGLALVSSKSKSYGSSVTASDDAVTLELFRLTARKLKHSRPRRTPTSVPPGPMCPPESSKGETDMGGTTEFRRNPRSWKTCACAMLGAKLGAQRSVLCESAVGLTARMRVPANLDVTEMCMGMLIHRHPPQSAPCKHEVIVLKV